MKYKINSNIITEPRQEVNGFILGVYLKFRNEGNFCHLLNMNIQPPTYFMINLWLMECCLQQRLPSVTGLTKTALLALDHLCK